jgi:hypothetical protein
MPARPSDASIRPTVVPRPSGIASQRFPTSVLFDIQTPHPERKSPDLPCHPERKSPDLPCHPNAALLGTFSRENRKKLHPPSLRSLPHVPFPRAQYCEQNPQQLGTYPLPSPSRAQYCEQNPQQLGTYPFPSPPRAQYCEQHLGTYPLPFGTLAPIPNRNLHPDFWHPCQISREKHPFPPPPFGTLVPPASPTLSPHFWHPSSRVPHLDRRRHRPPRLPPLHPTRLRQSLLPLQRLLRRRQKTRLQLPRRHHGRRPHHHEVRSHRPRPAKPRPRPLKFQSHGSLTHLR